MTATAATKPRTARAPIRTPDAPEEAPAREPIRAKTRARKGGITDQYHVPPGMIPDGVDLQWNVDTVLGQPDVQGRVHMEQQGWEPVLPEMFEGRFDGMFMRKGHKGEINVGGLVLMWRPIELTLEARAEENLAARQARYTEEAKIRRGSPDGVNTDVMNPNHGGARNANFVRTERIPSMPVSD